MTARIVVIGSANVDFVMPLPRLPALGESINGGPFLQSYGGKGSNQALAARRAGGDVTAVFCLGDDPHSHHLHEVYRKEGVETRYIRHMAGEHCGVGVIHVDADGNNAIGTDLGSNRLLSPEQVDEAEPAIAAASLVMLQMETEDPALFHAVEVAKRHAVPVMLNYAPFRPCALPLTRAIRYLVVNETEAASLTGHPTATLEEAMQAASLLAAHGHALVVVTLGDKGAVAFERGEGVHYPAFPIHAVDATGAGDAFCGALAVALAEGRPSAAAVRFASAAGALCAASAGAMPSLPRRDAIMGMVGWEDLLGAGGAFSPDLMEDGRNQQSPQERPLL